MVTLGKNLEEAKKGAWYEKGAEGSQLYYIGDGKASGFINGVWEDEIEISSGGVLYYVPDGYSMIPKEGVFDLMKREAEKRGFLENDVWYLTPANERGKRHVAFPYFQEYEGSKGYMVFGGAGLIWKNGKWGEVVKMGGLENIGGYSGLFNMEKKTVSYGCKSFGFDFVLGNEILQLDSIVFDGITVTPKQIRMVRKALRKKISGEQKLRLLQDFSIEVKNYDRKEMPKWKKIIDEFGLNITWETHKAFNVADNYLDSDHCKHNTDSMYLNFGTVYSGREAIVVDNNSQGTRRIYEVETIGELKAILTLNTTEV